MTQHWGHTTRDEDGGRAPAVLTVLSGPPGEDGLWAPLVADVGRVTGLEPSYVVLDEDDRWPAGVLRVAAACPGPVLVLPSLSAHPAGRGMVAPPRLRRVTIASDGSAAVARGVRLCSLHLLRSGVDTTVLLVLDDGSAPPMWEGPGHHATAWRDELGRRHGVSDRIEVVSGAPGPTVRAHLAKADLLVLLWHQAAGEGRANVLRAVLDGGIDQPCLLLPLDWVVQAEPDWACLLGGAHLPTG